MLNLTYEFKLKPTEKQVAIFEDWLEQCRRVYNYDWQSANIGLGPVTVRLTLALSVPSSLFLLRQNDQLMLASVMR